MKKIHLEFDFRGQHYFAIVRAKDKLSGKEFAITVLDWKLERLLYGNRPMIWITYGCKIDG